MAARLPLWGKLIYGTGAGGWSLVDRAMITYLYAFYITSPVEGVDALMPPMLFGIIMFFGRIVDALADPIIARYSDNLKNKRGRRLPFMMGGGIIYVAVFLALFYPPVSSNSPWNSFYLLVLLALYFTLFTTYVTPYLALLPELSRTNRDRVDLSTSKALFTLAGNAIALVGGGFLMGWLGYHQALWMLAVIALILLYLPSLIREKDYAVSSPSTLNLIDAVKTTLSNRSFLIYLVGNNAFWFGFNIITLNLVLYVTVLLGLTEGDTDLFMAAAFVVAALFFPLINLLCKKWGLKNSMLLTLALFALVLPPIYFFGQPVGGLDPEIFAYLVLGAAGVPLAGLFIIPDAILAAVSDLELKLSGQNREGMYFGTQGFLLKINLGVSTLVSSGLLQIFGEPLGIRLTGPVAGFFILVGLLIFLGYPEKEVIRFRKENIVDEEI